MTLLSDVEAALPDEFTGVMGIWVKIKRRSNPRDVAAFLDLLVKLGKAEFAQRVSPKAFAGDPLYRRARLPQQRAA